MVKSYKSLTVPYRFVWCRVLTALTFSHSRMCCFFSAVPHCCSQSLASRIPHQVTSCCSRWNAWFVRSHSAMPRRHPQALHYTSFQSLNSMTSLSHPYPCTPVVLTSQQRTGVQHPAPKPALKGPWPELRHLGIPNSKQGTSQHIPKPNSGTWWDDVLTCMCIYIYTYWHVLIHFDTFGRTGSLNSRPSVNLLAVL